MSSDFFATLDDLPVTALEDIDEIARLTIGKFASYHGIVVYGDSTFGHRMASDDDNNAWGRSCILPSRETLRMKFSYAVLQPLGTATTPVFFATRVINSCGLANDTIAILFEPECGKAHEHVLDTSSSSKVSCRKLPVVSMGLFRRHDAAYASASACCKLEPKQLARLHDPHGFELIVPSSYSVHRLSPTSLPKKTRNTSRNFELENKIAESCRATASDIVFELAGEFLGFDIQASNHTSTDVTDRLACVPITEDKYLKEHDGRRAAFYETARGVCSEQATRAALHNAHKAVDLMSAESLVALRSHPFTQGSMPDFLCLPSGLSLVLSVAMRLAVCWRRHALPCPSPCDLAANDRLRMAWTTQIGPPLPHVKGDCWAIDLVLRATIPLSLSDESYDMAKAENVDLCRDTFDIRMKSLVMFWQRVGQRLITRHFNHNTFDAALTKFGKPSRFQNPFDRARATAMSEADVACEGADELSVKLQSVVLCKTQILEMVGDTETWLRKGTYLTRVLATPIDTILNDSQLDQIQTLVGDLFESTPARPPRAPKLEFNPLAYKMGPHMNPDAIGNAIHTVRDMFLYGVRAHHKHCFGAFVVAPMQEMRCSECDEKITALGAVLFANSYSMCDVCYTRRCSACTRSHASLIFETTNKATGDVGLFPFDGNGCVRCGSKPSHIRVQQTGGSQFMFEMVR